MATVYAALELGLRDYCRKCGFESVVLGLSGGVDSAVSACIAVGAMGAARVTGVAMPSRYSSPGSLEDARELAERLDIRMHEISIEAAHEAMERTLASCFAGTAAGAAEENIQARLRGLILMSFSNKFGSLLLSTGNKSESAVGYATLYGDMAGGLAVLQDVPKTMVFRLARWISSPGSPLHQEAVGKRGEAIPGSTLTKPPSAELKPGQRDQDALPSYDVLDRIIEGYVEREESAKQIIDATGFDSSTVRRIIRAIDGSEYKRKQAPPGLKVTARGFGLGRRMPIAMRVDWEG